MKQFWNERFTEDTFAYGKAPNEFLKENIHLLQQGNILFVAEGEGRNAVFAARSGWTAEAFDISAEGKNKALKLAETNNVSIDYQIGELETLSYQPEEFDAIALIYAHFPAAIKAAIHQQPVSTSASGTKPPYNTLQP